MAGRHHSNIRTSHLSPHSNSSFLLKVPFLLLLAMLLALLTASTRLSLFTPSTYLSYKRSVSSLSAAERSFVRSLRTFLITKPRHIFAHPSSEALSRADKLTRETLVKDLDNAVWRREGQDLATNVLRPPLKVYVYDMPSKFTYDLLRLFHDTFEETSNLTSNGSPVHRLIEQHSVDYWLWVDLLSPESERVVKTVLRVYDQADADIFYIPFFTSISYFLLEKPKRNLLYREAHKWITSQPAWQRSGGRDHVLPVHHPWSFKSHRRYMKHAIWLLPDMDSTGNWYKPGEVSLEKDVVLPYVTNVEVCFDQCLASSMVHRTTLLFFRGRRKRNAGGKIRSKLLEILNDEADVVIEEGSAGDVGRAAAQQGMRRATFCLSPAGDTPSSARLFDAIVSGCIPVIVSDELELPFEGLIDYRKIVVFASSHEAIQRGWMVSYLRNISTSRILDMQSHLARVSKHFQYSHPAQPLGPEDMTWQMIAGKLPSIKLHIRRAQRVVMGSRSVCRCDCKHANQSLILQ